MLSEEMFFPFEPVPKGRPKFTRTGHTYTPKKTRTFERDIKTYYQTMEGKLITGPVAIRIIFYMPIPKSTSKKVLMQMETGDYHHIKKPDLDNLAKAVLDALNGVAFEDDSRIVILKLSKMYSRSPGIWLAIKEVV